MQGLGTHLQNSDPGEMWDRPRSLCSSVSSVAVASMVKPGEARTLPRETSTQTLGRAGGWGCGEARIGSAGEQEDKLVRFGLKDATIANLTKFGIN